MHRVKLIAAALLLFPFGLCIYLSWHAPHSILAFSSGPPPGRTGAPGDESTCLFCHRSFPLNDPSGGVVLDGLPDSYTPGEPIDFDVTVFQDGTPEVRKNWGFELTVLDGNNIFVGTLVATDSVNTKVIMDDDEARGRFYIEQTAAGTFFDPSGSDMATWTITWIPPDEDVGPITFYVAANAGNGDGTILGDYIFTTNQAVDGPSAKMVARGRRPVSHSDSLSSFKPMVSHLPYLRRAPVSVTIKHRVPTPIRN